MGLDDGGDGRTEGRLSVGQRLMSPLIDQSDGSFNCLLKRFHKSKKIIILMEQYLMGSRGNRLQDGQVEQRGLTGKKMQRQSVN